MQIAADLLRGSGDPQPQWKKQIVHTSILHYSIQGYSFRIHLYSLRYIRRVVLCKVRVLTAEESVFQLLKTLHQLEEMSDACRPCSPSEVWHISEEKERHQDSCWSYQIFILLNSLLTPEHNMHILHTINLVNISNGTNRGNFINSQEPL